MIVTRRDVDMLEVGSHAAAKPEPRKDSKPERPVLTANTTSPAYKRAYAQAVRQIKETGTIKW